MSTHTPSGHASLPARTREGHYLAVIEAVRGSRNKLKFAPARGTFELHHVLPVGTSFPFDFGFVPETLGADGDPLDVLVFMDEPVPAGVVVPCRLLGVIEATQKDGERRAFRNDRLLAVASESQEHRRLRTLASVERRVLAEIERFCVFYNEQRGVRFTPLRRRGPAVARALVERGRRVFAAQRAGPSPRERTR